MFNDILLIVLNYIVHKPLLDYVLNCYIIFMFDLIFFVTDYYFIPLVIMGITYIVLSKKLADIYWKKKKLNWVYISSLVILGWHIWLCGIYILLIFVF